MANGNGNSNAIVPAGPSSVFGQGMGGMQQYNPRSGTEEMRLGQRQFPIPGVGRIQAPENANADSSLITPEDFQKAAIYQVPSVIGVQGDFTYFQMDFNTLANYQYVRAAADFVGAVGRNDQRAYQFALTGVGTGLFRAGRSGVAPLFSGPNQILGFQIEWGLSILNFAPFSMRVYTNGFKNIGFAPVDRDVTLRFGGDGGAMSNGGVFQMLFGQRMTSSNSCGDPVAAAGGMNLAIAQAATIPVYLDSEVDETKLVPWRVTTPTDFPAVFIEIPAALEGSFAATTHLITAASPYLASTREALFLDQ